MKEASTAPKQFAYSDTIADIKQQLSIEIIRDFLISTPEKAIQLIAFFEKRKLAGNLSAVTIAQYDNQIKKAEAALEHMLNMSIEVYGINVEAIVDAKPEKQQAELPFTATDKKQAEESKPSIPEANKKAKKLQWEAVKEELINHLNTDGYEEAFKYALTTLGSANYIPKKAHVSPKAWKETEIHELLKNLNKISSQADTEKEAIVAENKERVAEQTPITTAPAKPGNENAAAKGFITNELKEINLLKNVISGIFDVPGNTSSDGVASNGLGFEETRQRIQDFKSIKPTFDLENKALNIMADAMYKRHLNAAVLAAATGSTEEDLKASCLAVANMFFSGRPNYSQASINEWMHQAIAGPIENHFTILKTKENEKLFPEAIPTTKIEDATIVSDDPANQPEKPEDTDLSYKDTPLYKKCVILGLNNALVQAELEAFTPQEQVELFLDSDGDQKLELLLLDAISERIRQFFSKPKSQSEVDSFMNLVNLFFEKRPYDRKNRRIWSDTVRKQGAGTNHMSILVPQLAPESTATETKDKEATPAAETPTQETQTVEEKVHYVERSALVKHFKGCINKKVDQVEAINNLESKLFVDGKYVEVRQIDKAGATVGTITMANKKDYTGLMGIIWNEALGEIAVEKPTESQKQEITTMVDITKKGFEWLKAKDKPDYATFLQWACSHLLNKRLIGQKEGREFKTEKEVENFVKGTFGKMLPASKPIEVVKGKEVETSETREEAPFKKTEEEIHADFRENVKTFEKYSQAVKWLKNAYNENDILDRTKDEKGIALSLKAIATITQTLLEDTRPELLPPRDNQQVPSTEVVGKLSDSAAKSNLAIDSLPNKTLDGAYSVAKALYEESTGNPDQALAFCHEVFPQLEETKTWDSAQIAMWFKTAIMDVVDNKATKPSENVSIEEPEALVVSKDILVIDTCKNKHDFKQAVSKIFQTLGDTPDVRSQLVAAITAKKGAYTRQIGKMPVKEIHAMLNSIKAKLGSVTE